MGFGCEWQMGKKSVSECTCGLCQRACAGISAFVSGDWTEEGLSGRRPAQAVKAAPAQAEGEG